MTKPKPKLSEEGAQEPRSVNERIDGIFDSQVALIERVEMLEARLTGLEERVNGPPIKLGKRP